MNETHSARSDLTASLTTVPRLTAEQWRALNPMVRWLIAVRASVLVMTFSAAALGGLLALIDQRGGTVEFHAGRWLLAAMGLLLAHATNNLLNDLTDTLRGVDTGNYFRTRYGTHVLQQGLISPSRMWLLTGATGAAALAIGLWLVQLSGTALLWPLVPGAIFLVFYTWPLKQWGLGELAVLLVWGPLMVGGTYMASTGAWSWPVAGVGLLFGIGPTLVIFGKHIDKIGFDADKGVATLPVRLGELRARRWVGTMIVAQYLGVLALVAIGALPWPALIVLASLPVAWRTAHAFALPRPAERPAHWPETIWPLWFAAVAFALARSLGLLLMAGLLAGFLLA